MREITSIELGVLRTSGLYLIDQLRTGFRQKLFSLKTCPQVVLQAQQEKSGFLIFTTSTPACISGKWPLNTNWHPQSSFYVKSSTVFFKFLIQALSLVSFLLLAPYFYPLLSIYETLKPYNTDQNTNSIL